MSGAHEAIRWTSELDERDVAVVVELARRKVLSTEHIFALFFGSLRRAQAKVQELRERGLIRTLPSRGRTKTSERHALTADGARVAAVVLGRRPSQIALPERDADLWRSLAHRMGVNEFFCRLVMACERRPGAGVHAWDDEHALRGGGQQVQADAFGRLLHPGGAVEFLLEYDRGTEHFVAMVKKLGRYLTVSSAHAPNELLPFPGVLFLVGGEAREAMVARAFGVALEREWDLDRARSAAMPIYVTNRRRLRADGHLGPVWAPLAGPEARLRLTELPGAPERWWELSECLRIRWIGPEHDR